VFAQGTWHSLSTNYLFPFRPVGGDPHERYERQRSTKLTHKTKNRVTQTAPCSRKGKQFLYRPTMTKQLLLKVALERNQA
jgi:hypothetical protein